MIHMLKVGGRRDEGTTGGRRGGGRRWGGGEGGKITDLNIRDEEVEEEVKQMQ